MKLGPDLTALRLNNNVDQCGGERTLSEIERTECLINKFSYGAPTNPLLELE